MTTEEIKEKIDRLFADTSVDPATTRERLEEIAEHCEMLCQTLGDE